MKIGRKIYFDKITGDPIVTIVERQGFVTKTTLEQDIKSFTALTERNRETFDVIELEFGSFAQDFSECNGYRVNPQTKQLEFSYPGPNQPEAEPIFTPPLSETVNAHTEYLIDVDFRLSMVELGI